MRFSVLAPILLAAVVGSAGAAHAGTDAVAECKNFFKKFQTCIDGLQGDQKDEATVFMKTTRGILGISDDLNRGDPMMLGIMCGGMMEELKKDASVQQYKCQW